MASNIEYDPHLLSEVLKVGGFKYKKDAVNAALKEYLQRHRQIEILDLFGSIEYDKEYDYKNKRNR
jgi:Arc/MetJ family transcription regulator